jgi:hypothetical protein
MSRDDSDYMGSMGLHAPRNDLAFGDGVRAAVAARGIAGQAMHGGGVVGGGVAINARQRYGAQVTATRISNGWMIEDGEGMRHAALSDRDAIEAIVCWCRDRQSSVNRINRPATRIPDTRSGLSACPETIAVRQTGNGWIVFTFDGRLEMIAMDPGGVGGMVLDWMACPNERAPG